MSSDWIEELKGYFFGHRQEDLDVNAAIELKQRHIPRSLYKYRAVNEFSLDNLLNDTVWCTNAAAFNDPYDSSLCFDFSDNIINGAVSDSLRDQITNSDENIFKAEDFDLISESDNPLKSLIDVAAKHTETSITPDMADKLYEVLTKVTSNQIVEMNERFNTAIKQGYKICSFSERVNSMLMWSHYSENHTGFVMEYDFPELGVSDVRSRCIWPVLYDNNLFDASAFIGEREKSESFNNLFGIIASIHKAKDWSYEHEWRLILPFSPSEPSLNYPVPKPKAIHLGSKIKPEHKSEIIKIAKSKGIDVCQVKLSHNKFEMVSSKIEFDIEDNHNNPLKGGGEKDAAL